MATRFYLPSTGSPPVTPPALPSGWVDQSPAHYDAPALTSKSDTALTDFTVTDSTSSQTNVAVGCFVSEVLAAQAISGTVSAVIAAFGSVSAADDSLQVGVYLIAGDGSSVKQALYAGHTEALQSVNAVGVLGQEFDSGQFESRIIPATALTSQDAEAGDRLMIVVGYRTHDISASARASSLRLGDPADVADQALTADLTTNLVPWVELSATLQFGADQPFSDLTDAFDAVTGLWPNSYGGTAVSGGQAVVDCDAGQFSGFKSAAGYHLAGSQVGGEFSPPAANGGSSAYMSILVTTTTPGTDAGYNIDNGFLGVLLREGFSDAGALFPAYDPVNHAWLRLREDAGTLYWEASPDGSSWTELRSETSPAWVSDPDLAFVVECKRADGGDNTGTFDNVNNFSEVAEPSEVTLTPAELHLTAVALDPQPGAVTVALTPAALHLAAVPVDADPGPVTVALTPAAVHLAAAALTPQPGPVTVALSPAVLVLAAVALGFSIPGGQYVARPSAGTVARTGSGYVSR